MGTLVNVSMQDSKVGRQMCVASVTRLGDLLDFGQLFKPLAIIKLPKSSTFLRKFCKVVKIYHFLLKSFLCHFYRHLAIFFWSHSVQLPPGHNLLNNFYSKVINGLVDNRNVVKGIPT